MATKIVLFTLLVISSQLVYGVNIGGERQSRHVRSPLGSLFSGPADLAKLAGIGDNLPAVPELPVAGIPKFPGVGADNLPAVPELPAGVGDLAKLSGI